MLADCVETLVDRPKFKVSVTELERTENGYSVVVDASLMFVLRNQRAMHKLSVAQVAKHLGISQLTYSAYENGLVEPSLTKFCEALAIVAPNMAVTVRPSSKAKR